MRIGTVLVRGPSMVPALRDGDWLVVARGARVRKTGSSLSAYFWAIIFTDSASKRAWAGS